MKVMPEIPDGFVIAYKDFHPVGIVCTNINSEWYQWFFYVVNNEWVSHHKLTDGEMREFILQ